MHHLFVPNHTFFMEFSSFIFQFTKKQIAFIWLSPALAWIWILAAQQQQWWQCAPLMKAWSSSSSLIFISPHWNNTFSFEPFGILRTTTSKTILPMHYPCKFSKSFWHLENWKFINWEAWFFLRENETNKIRFFCEI